MRKRAWQIPLLLFFLSVALASAAPKRVRLVPELRAGQSWDYLVSLQTSRDIKTQSRVAVPNLPVTDKLDAFMRIHVEVLAQQKEGTRLSTNVSLFPVDLAPPKNGPAPAPDDPKAEHSVEFTLQSAGSATRISGLDALASDEQAAWQEWLARFAAPMLYPARGIERGDQWESEERETAPSPIANLVWIKKSEYVRDEPCPAARGSNQSDLGLTKTSETCAVVLTTAILKQKSSAKNSTPEDYALNHLRTRGAASGKNETILYISRSTGLLMRASETATQAMDVTISLADETNQVHYVMNGKSQARVLFLDSTSAPPKR